LFAFAHIPDALALAGGTMVKYTHVGWQINVVCATQQGKERFGDLLSTLGIASASFLEYQPGMLAKEHPGELEDKLYEALLQFVPEVVITHDPTGLTNHPDHTKVFRSATFAFQKYAKEAEQMRHQRERPKLYYACVPERTVRYLQSKKMLPPELYGRPVEGTEDKFITTVIDVKRFVRTKLTAIQSAGLEDQEGLSVFQLPTLARQEQYLLRMVGTQEAFMGKTDRIVNRL